MSSARNTGLHVARGEIVAYIDDDARPDPHWLRYLAAMFREGDWAAVGGPNLTPSEDTPLADCVGNAPGGPIHVLLSDRQAEHIPGCNMAFRRPALVELGGFDPRFRCAGDDVDVCWRLHERGLRIGFSPAAVVWHHPRRSVRAFLRQQSGYGRAEAMLERKWPEKYNRAWQIAWRGRLYGAGHDPGGARRWRVYYGTQGSGLFQSVYQPAGHGLGALALMPEWYLVIGVLATLALLGATWRPLLLVSAPLLALALGAVLVRAVRGAARARFATAPSSRRERLRMRGLTALLHVLQPAARLHGRLRHGLKPRPARGKPSLRWSAWRTWAFWSERWSDPPTRLLDLERRLRAAGATTVRGGDFDRWDLEARVGVLAAARLLLAVEDHPGGAQLVRLRAVPRLPLPAAATAALFVAFAIVALLDHEPVVAAGLASLGAALLAFLAIETAALAGAVAAATEETNETLVETRRTGLRRLAR